MEGEGTPMRAAGAAEDVELEMQHSDAPSADERNAGDCVDDVSNKQGSAAEKGGVLAEGEEVRLWEPRNVGFIMQYFAVGIVLGGLPSTVYGLFLGYLNVPGYVYATAGVITTLPWSFKFLWGLINDCVPIMGYRRKPYMVMGWAMCAAMLLVLSQHKLPEPYYCRDAEGEYIKTPGAEPCNPSARDKGGEYAMLMCLAALGYVIADVAADGLMVEYAQREPEKKRGTTQTMIYLVRTLGMILSTVLVAFGMNGKEYNGTFDRSLTFNQVCGILAAPVLLMVPVSHFLVQEERVAKDARKSLRSYLRDAWDLLTSKAFFYVVLFQFWEPFVGRISTPGAGLVKREWAGVKVLQAQLFSVASLFIFAGGLWLIKRHFLQASWRRMLFWTTVMLNVSDSLFAFLTIFGVVRNQYFYLGETILDDIPAAANFVVSTFIIVEMADKGNEGLVYGLLTTISNLSSPFSRAVGNQIFGLFEPDLSKASNYVEDSAHFRNVVAGSFALGYCFSFAALAFLVLLPKQKQEAQERKASWPRHQAYGYITVALVSAALVYSLTVNFMTMIPSTACLRFVGGKGCSAED